MVPARPVKDAGDGPLLCVLGPTASGKTALAIRLAEYFGGEIIVMDSAQIYRGLNIGAAKPSAAECARVPHHLLGAYDWHQVCNAAQWASAARAIIADLRQRDRLPILCGGTFLYLRALLEGLHDLPPADPIWRAQASARLRREGSVALHAQLAERDPPTAARIHPNDSQRILRALEILEQGAGREKLFAAGAPQGAWSGPVLKLALMPGERRDLRARIAERFSAMLAAGLWEEARAIYAHPDFDPSLPALKSVGYRQLFAAIAGDCEENVAVERAIIASRQYAKRQLTWLRRDTELHWLDSLQADLEPKAIAIVKETLV